MSIGLMVGSFLLKNIYNMGDETFAQAWVINPYIPEFNLSYR